MKIVQFKKTGNKRAVGIVLNNNIIKEVKEITTVYELAQKAIEQKVKLIDMIEKLGFSDEHDYQELLTNNQILVPFDHPDPIHTMISGTGLTHLGSASTRDEMHQKKQEISTDTLKMFQLGIEGGKPEIGKIGVQPEWFYKGDGSIVVNPGEDLIKPSFAEDAGEEPEIVGIYVISKDGQPYRIGFAVGNEFSDHVMEKRNYLYLAHSKLRACSFGPELLLGELPQKLSGISRIIRDGKILWEKEFLSGEENMCHSIENLEHHHFKYSQFLRPGDVHIHYFGTATLSVADNIKTQNGDQFEIAIKEFGQPLINRINEITSEDSLAKVNVL
ncbi:AraD1 family protein [Acinetobacter baumannii]|uniref:AraD1 family protein n=1 Tax=Acinetobacter baumannii TaxID=470 RepID=UPI003B430072